MNSQRHVRARISTALATWLVLSLGPTAVIGQEENGSGEDSRPELSDHTIALAVENELLSSEAVASHRVDASCTDGVVTLSGKIDNLLAKRRASELAQHVKGVLAVVNQIVVLPVDREDDKIEQDIRRAWADDHVTEPFELGVAVKYGEAKLSGRVDSHAERSLAEDIAAGVRGVTAVENEIEVEFETDRTDEEIREELQALMDSSVELGDADVDVSVEDGDVVLNGKVGTAFAKSVAMGKAWIPGVKSVDVRGIDVDYDMYDGTRRRKRLRHVTDDRIIEWIERALRRDPRVLSYLDTIDVTSDRGAVTLTGKVGRLRAKNAAEEVARTTLGVWRLANHLKVRSPEEPPTALEIIEHVQAALRRDPYVARHTIRVHCRNAHVSLYGQVDSEFERRAAGYVASGQRGVVHVNNYLAVAKRWEPRSDAQIKADIEEKLTFTFFDKSNDIEVTVEDGVAILRGKVDTWLGWQTAMNKAIEAGARSTHNLLKVRFHPQHGGSRIYVPE